MDYETLTVSIDKRVATVTIDNPPVNVITSQLFGDLRDVSKMLAVDDEVLVVVLESANDEFFMAHYDVELLVNAPEDSDPDRPMEIHSFDRLCERFRTMPKVTIAKIAGRVGGGGSEIAMACDMRYAALGRAIVNQMEVPIGILPGAGGTQRLPRLVGWGRAAEIILGGVDIDAATGERWGYFDRALATDELDRFVDALASRIASFPPEAVRHAKAAMVEGASMPLHEGLINESFHFDQLMARPDSRAAMQRFLDLGGQTPDGERTVAELSARAARAGSDD